MELHEVDVFSAAVFCHFEQIGYSRKSGSPCEGRRDVVNFYFMYSVYDN